MNVFSNELLKWRVFSMDVFIIYGLCVRARINLFTDTDLCVDKPRFNFHCFFFLIIIVHCGASLYKSRYKLFTN